MQKPIITLIMPLSFNLLTNHHFQGDFLNKLYIYEQVLDFNRNLLLELYKIHFQHLLFFSFFVHRTTKEFLAFIKATVHAFVTSIAFALFSVD